MNQHDGFEELLANYRGLSPEEQALVDQHMKTCDGCAARFAEYAEVDRALAELEEIRLPARLARPLSAVLQDKQPAQAGSLSRPGLVFGRGLMPASVIVLLLVVLSVALWSVNTDDVPVTATPTLTLTLTPTLASATLTEIAFPSGDSAHDLPETIRQASTGYVPSPRPVPAPGEARKAVLLVTNGAHATIIR